MSVLLVLMGLWGLLRFSNCGPAPQERSGCLEWDINGEKVCCVHCHPGHRLVSRCGPDPRLLCTPCKAETFTSSSTAERCQRCKQCIDPQVLERSCSPYQDTQCGCREGFLCGDKSCSFCVQECGRGQEPTGQRACQPCPQGTYNDQTHHKCKPWTRCDKNTVKHGDAFSDARCGNVSALPVVVPGPNEPSQEQSADGLSFILYTMFGVVVPALLIVIIVMAITQIKQKQRTQRPEPETAVKKPPIITDEPQTLIAIECSFHEAEQEQGRSSESLLPGQ
ncbi:unnamed protein product [Knipowitschia caucasica]